MDKKLSIVGGTYHEVCLEPASQELYGSALRAAAALSGRGFRIELTSCIAEVDLASAKSICDTFKIIPSFQSISETVGFHYYHPLSPPEISGLYEGHTPIQLPSVASEYVLYYGMIEAMVAVKGKYVVYDPQNHIPFSETGSSADHLAVVLNKKEAYLISGANDGIPLGEVGKMLLSKQNAEVIVIKNGSKGAVVIGKNKYDEIPVFKTETVWPIGSGDIFSAVFAWQWAIDGLPAVNAALLASKYTGTYCQSKLLPLPASPDPLSVIDYNRPTKKIYLAGPFFTMSQRWLINEFRDLLMDFGNNVFSPYHDIGLPDTNDIKSDSIAIADKDLAALKQSDLLLAVLCDTDPGTLFEIGYAKALNKNIIIFSENISEADLLMMYGSGCKVVSDFSTAVYMSSWQV